MMEILNLELLFRPFFFLILNLAPRVAMATRRNGWNLKRVSPEWTCARVPKSFLLNLNKMVKSRQSGQLDTGTRGSVLDIEFRHSFPEKNRPLEVAAVSSCRLLPPAACVARSASAAPAFFFVGGGGRHSLNGTRAKAWKMERDAD